MKKRTRSADGSQLLLDCVVEGLQEKKGKDIICLDLRHINNAVADHFVICTGDSNTHVEALAGSVEFHVKNTIGDRPWHVEGRTISEWVLVDYVDVVVHVFQPHSREFYSLENLWADAKLTEYAEA